MSTDIGHATCKVESEDSRVLYYQVPNKQGGGRKVFNMK